MAIPAFRDDGWLPDGHHSATWEEVIAVFSGQPGSRREHVMRAVLDYARCKESGFDLFVFSAAAAHKFPAWTHLDLFDRDKMTGKSKGVLEVLL